MNSTQIQSKTSIAYYMKNRVNLACTGIKTTVSTPIQFVSKVALKALQYSIPKLEKVSWYASVCGIGYFGSETLKKVFKYIALKSTQHWLATGKLPSAQIDWTYLLLYGLSCDSSSPKAETSSYTSDSLWRLTVEPAQRIYRAAIGVLSGDLAQATNIALIEQEAEAACYDASKPLDGLRLCILAGIILTTLRGIYHTATFINAYRSSLPENLSQENSLQEAISTTCSEISEEQKPTTSTPPEKVVSPLSPELLQAIESELRKHKNHPIQL